MSWYKKLKRFAAKANQHPLALFIVTIVTFVGTFTALLVDLHEIRTAVTGPSPQAQIRLLDLGMSRKKTDDLLGVASYESQLTDEDFNLARYDFDQFAVEGER